MSKPPGRSMTPCGAIAIAVSWPASSERLERPALSDAASEPCRSALPAVAAAAWRRLKKQGRGLRPSDPDAEFHELRKRAKRARYTAELIAPIMGRRAARAAGRFIRLLTQIQDTLGEHQDAVVAADEIEHVLAEHAHDPAFVRAANSLLASEHDKAHAARESFFKVWDKLDRKKSRRWMKIAPKVEGWGLSQRYLDPVDPSKQALPVLNQHPDHDARATVKDPVCGMDVVPATAAGSVDHDGRTYHFCSRHCVEKFRADPARYLGQAGTRTATARGRGRRARPPLLRPMERPTPARCTRRSSAIGPGSCPICGMALEPMTVSADEDVDPELDDMSRRFWICLVLTIPLLLALDGRDGSGSVVSGLPHGPGVWSGFNSPWRPRWSCGAGCRSSSAAGRRSSAVISICSR